ncbi:MAG: hypothetical protein KIS65_00530 [Nitrosomonas sp.]|nr:hypothetical protein [Nitrosomonas sp.]
MLTLSIRHQMIIALLLTVLMIITRSHYFVSMHNLPGASWAVFFLAGVYLRAVWPLPALLALAWWLDYMAYAWGGVSDFCLTPAYAFLLPAYASLWLAGRWYAERHHYAWRSIMPLSLSIMSGLILCELFSSGGFYFFSGHFADATWLEYAERMSVYFPMYVESFLFYAGFAIAIHIIIVSIRQSAHLRDTASD